MKIGPILFPNCVAYCQKEIATYLHPPPETVHTKRDCNVEQTDRQTDRAGMVKGGVVYRFSGRVEVH